MPCSKHAMRLASCPDCTAEFLLEENLLSLGPRTKRQFRALKANLKAARIPPNIKMSKGLYCHRVHRLARYVKDHVDSETPVCKLPEAPHILALLQSRRNDNLVSRLVHFTSRNTARGMTPLKMFDKASLEKGIRGANIKGHKMVELAGEYAAACSDVSALLAEKRIFTDSITVWHADVVPAKTAAALQRWEELNIL